VRFQDVKDRGVFVLPSLFTTASLFCGFYALIAAIQGRYELAAWVIIIAAIFDMLDGRVARLLHAETDFGAEYDSLCDMLSFGVAPAVLLYLWALVPLHKLGWLVAFLFAAAAAVRLARFNTKIETQDKRYFQGLPTPAAALFVMTGVLFVENVSWEPYAYFWMLSSLLMSFLMVSNVPFISGKDIDLKKRQPVALVVFLLLLIVLLMWNPPAILFAVFMAYCMHGPLLVCMRVLRYRRLCRQRRRRAKARSAAIASDGGSPDV